MPSRGDTVLIMSHHFLHFLVSSGLVRTPGQFQLGRTAVAKSVLSRTGRRSNDEGEHERDGADGGSRGVAGVTESNGAWEQGDDSQYEQRKGRQT